MVNQFKNVVRKISARRRKNSSTILSLLHDESSWKLSVPESIIEIGTLHPCDTAVFEKVISLEGNGI